MRGRAGRKDRRLRITFFVGSVVGYVDNPSALLTRGVAHGLALRGNDIRIVEERQNQAFVRTLQVAGADASRHFYDQFGAIQHHTYEARTGPRLLEWVTRELALIDVAVAVAGLEDELCRWIANVTREELARAYLTYEPEVLTEAGAEQLDIHLYDFVLAPRQPAADLPWRQVPYTVAVQDRERRLSDQLSAQLRESAIDPIEAAIAFERALSGRS